MKAEVNHLTGPGALDISFRVNLQDLRTRLIDAGHPIGAAPQWDSRIWMIKCEVKIDDPDLARETASQVFLIKAKTEERAREVALAHLTTRSGPDWQINLIEEVVCGSPQVLHRMEV